MLFFGPMGGVFADRRDKQRILYVTQTLAGVVSAAFAILIVTGSIRLWIVYLLAIALGFVNVFDNPARQSFISEMVPTADLSNAVTLNSVSVNMARVLGAALGGGIVALLGVAACFGANALSFGAVLISLALMSKSLLYPARRVKKESGQIRQGLRYVRGTPELLIPLIMIAVIGTLAWEFQVSLPLMATKVLGGGALTTDWALAVPGGDRLGHRHLRGRPGAEHDHRTRRDALRRVRQHHVQFLRQDRLAAHGQAADARPRHGAVGPGVARLDADRRPDHRLGQEFGARWSLVIGGVPTAACGLLALPALTAIDRRAARREVEAELAELAGEAELADEAELAGLQAAEPGWPGARYETRDAKTTVELR
jgi:hypothetical protein